LLAFIQSKYPEYHPIMAMVEIARNVDHMGEDGDRSLAFQCHKEVAKYVVAVDRISEIRADIVKTKRVVVEMFGAPSQENKDDGVIDMSRATPPQLGDNMAVMDVVEKRTVMTTVGPVEEADMPLSARYLEQTEEHTSMTASFS
jgi:hypothetical protein